MSYIRLINSIILFLTTLFIILTNYLFYCEQSMFNYSGVNLMAVILNDEQKTIVEYTGDKFLSVQAGPGSGKTRVIVEKVKYMVKELKINPESFLIITFSNKAAEELQDRLIEGEIPASDVQKMQISTIHSFCLKILEETGTVGLDVISEGDKINLFIKKHLNELGFEKESYIRTYEIANIISKYDEYSTFQVDIESLVEYTLKRNSQLILNLLNLSVNIWKRMMVNFLLTSLRIKKVNIISIKNHILMPNTFRLQNLTQNI